MGEDKIIVFRQFENSIEASIVKTKLDAYGIPCFLSDENIAGLYPLHSFRQLGVRLHLFACDAERARQILEEREQ